MSIKHLFTSAKSDGADSSLVRASNWNADHTIDDGTITAAKLASGIIGAQISALTAAEAALGTQEIPVNEGGTSKKVTVAQIKTYVGGGALVLLEQHSASASASLDFTTCISATYDEYLIEMLQVVPATNANTCLLQFSIDGGSTYIAGSSYVDHVFVGGAGIAVTGTTTGSSIRTSWCSGSFLSNTTGIGQSGNIRLMLAQNGSSYPCITGTMSGQLTDGNAVWIVGGNYHVAGAAINAFRFLMNSGNIASGTIRVYGIAKA